MSIEITSALIIELRDKTNTSLQECKRALEKCNGDILLAEGYLKYNGCAINVGGHENYKKWVMEMAKDYKYVAIRRENESSNSTIKKCDTDVFSELKVGSGLIPMSAFKQMEQSCVFAIPDDYIDLKDFLWTGTKKDVNGKEFTAFYCKQSFGNQLLAKIKEGDTEAIEKFLKDSMVSLSDYNN